MSSSPSNPPRRLELHLSYECRQRCAFCSEAERMARFRATAPEGRDALEALARMRERGFDHVTVTGGEPTLHPGLGAVLARAKELGYRTYLTTNGSRLARPEYAARILPLLDEVCISLHGPDSATHDALAGAPGSFDAAAAAIAAGAARGVRVLTNTVVTSDTFRRAAETLSLALSLGARHCLLSNVAPEGRAESAYERLTARLFVWPWIADGAARLASRAGAVARVFGVPLCALGRRAALSNDLYFSPRVTLERGEGPGVFAQIESPTPRRRRLKTTACGACAGIRFCGGVFDRYLALFGDAELKPLRGGLA